MDYWFSVNLKRYRSEYGLSQLQLACLLNVTQGCISQWETNRKYPRVDKLYDMAKVLGIAVEDLLKKPKENIIENNT